MSKFSKEQMQDVIRLLWSEKHEQLGLHHILLEIIDPEASMDLNYAAALEEFEAEYLPHPEDEDIDSIQESLIEQDMEQRSVESEENRIIVCTIA